MEAWEGGLLMMSPLALSLGVRFGISREGGTGEVGGFTQRVENSMDVSGLGGVEEHDLQFLHSRQIFRRWL